MLCLYVIEHTTANANTLPGAQDLSDDLRELISFKLVVAIAAHC